MQPVKAGGSTVAVLKKNAGKLSFKKGGMRWGWGQLRTSLLLCSVLQRRRINFISQAKPFSTVNEKLRGRPICYFRNSKTV